MFEKIATDSQMQFQTFTDLPELFQQLRKRQIRIGIATTDTIASTRHCLRKLQIEDLIDYVGADDGVARPKRIRICLKHSVKHMGLNQKKLQ